jgi:signal transduction histidine kinase
MSSTAQATLGEQMNTREMSDSAIAMLDEQGTVLAASFFCLQGAEGQALGVCAISVDVTENRRARERLAILSEASTRLGSTLDVMRNVDLEHSVPFG